MPGSLINNTLSNISSGVSEQYQEGRFDSQVEEMLNCMPSITRGVLRRNPLEGINKLSGLTADISNAYVYSYDRGTGDEQYIVVIPGDGTIHTYNANTGVLIYSTPVPPADEPHYLKVTAPATAKHSFKALTIGDQTFIVNQTVKTSFLEGIENLTPTRGYSDMAFYWIKKTASVVTNQYQTAGGTDPVESGSLMQGYEYTLNGWLLRGTEDTRPTFPEVKLNTSPKIAAQFKSTDFILDELGNPTTDTYASLSLAPKADGAVCYDDAFTGTAWKWEDSFGNEASLGVWKTVSASDKLPVILPEDLKDFIVKVVGNTSSEFDDYYLQYSHTNKTWKEIPAPGKKFRLDASTMPHVLYRLANGSFTFDTYQGVATGGLSLTGESEWGERHAGGDKEIDNPSFIGKPLTNIFFHKNRLGLITSDTVVLSQTGLYGDFFFQTLQDVLDDDPIDLAVASSDVTILRHAVSTSGQLIIFSDDTQFNIQSLEGPLTPNSADITALSNYTYGNVADAKAIGNKVYFTNQVGAFSQIYAYTVSDKGRQITEANNMTIHLPTYVDKSTARIIGHDVLGYIFIEEEDKPKELLVLTNVTKAGQDLQNAFHKWTFAKDIVSTHIINRDLHIVFVDGSLAKMKLDIPGKIDDVVYQDVYNNVDAPINYASSIEFSEFFYRQEGKGTVRGRYQIRTLQYTIEEASRYITYIENTNLSILDPLTMYGPTWTDTGNWNDNLIWIDADPNYIREYVDDDKVTVMTNSKALRIIFQSSVAEPSKGFEIATINIEGFFFQRSQRT